MTRLLIIMIVSGCCIFELGLLVNSSGIRFSVVIEVVIIIGCNWCNVFLCIVLVSVMLVVCSWLKWVISIRLLSIVMLSSVMKFIEVGIDRYCLVSYRVIMLLISVNGMLYRISIVWCIELKVENSIRKISFSVIGIIIVRCVVVCCWFLN